MGGWSGRGAHHATSGVVRDEGVNTDQQKGPGCQARGATNSPGGIRRAVREKPPSTAPSAAFREKLAARHKTPFGPLFVCWANALFPHQAISAPNIARAEAHAPFSAAQHDIETDDTSAHPNKGTVEIPSPLHPENRTKTPLISHPLKAMAVSIPHRHQQTRRRWFQTANGATWPPEPGCGAHDGGGTLSGQRADARATSAAEPRLVWAPEDNGDLAAVPVGGSPGGAWPGFETRRAKLAARTTTGEPPPAGTPNGPAQR